MREDQGTHFQDLRQPGIRRVLEAIQAIENDRPGPLEEAVLAARELAKNRNDRGGLPE
jgi:hypothetical protein